MIHSSPTPRHTVEKFDRHVRVILPSKRNIFRVLFVCLWFLLWGYMVSGLVYVAITVNQAMELGRNSTPPLQPGNVFFMLSICFSLFFLALLALGAFGLYRFGWLVSGKEVIEATPQALTVTKKIFRWERSRSYSSDKIKSLRTNTQPVSMFLPGKRVKRFLGGAGMIAFDYEGRTSTFGLEISQAEAEQIMLALKDGFPQQNAG